MYQLILRRKNGRKVKNLDRPMRSAYRAKKKADWFLETKYDDAYYITIEPVSETK